MACKDKEMIDATKYRFFSHLGIKYISDIAYVLRVKDIMEASHVDPWMLARAVLTESFGVP